MKIRNNRVDNSVMSVAYTQIRTGNREKKTMLAQKKKIVVRQSWLKLPGNGSSQPLEQPCPGKAL